MAAIRISFSFMGCRNGMFLSKKIFPSQKLRRIGGVSITLQAFHKRTDRRLADYWEEIHGENDWAGLLDPFDPLLREELIRYGDMAQACYDAYEEDPSARLGHRIKIEPQMFFENLGWTNPGYNVTSYIYSTYKVDVLNLFKKPLRSNEASWIGYVAVSNDEYSEYLGRRDITIAWRGTVTTLETFADLQDILTPIKNHTALEIDSAIKAEDGFLDIYTKCNESHDLCNKSARMQVLGELKRLLEKHSGEEKSITVTGHSLGSALATLNAYDIAETKQSDVPVCVFSFSGPRVGNFRFKQRMEELGVKVLRVRNVHDAVPKVPGIFLNESLPVCLQRIGEFIPWSYFHVGKEIMLDHKKSPFIKKSNHLSDVHNLELLLHLLDGYQGNEGEFSRAIGRDLKLVNKTTDLLIEECNILPKWKTLKEKLKLIKNSKEQNQVVEQLNLEDIFHSN